MPESNFSTLDWVIVGVYLAGTVAIGLYVNRYIRSMSDFLVAGRTLKTRLAIATMIGSELGLVTAMYSAEKGVTGGFAAFHIGLAGGIACLVVGLTGFIVVPLRRMEVMTIPEFYERRFGSRRLRILGGTILAVSGILNMGLFLRAGAIFVVGLTGLQESESIEPGLTVKLVMTVMILMVLAYTALGGMVSVVITDYLQFVVLSFGLIAACLWAGYEVGWINLVETVETIHGDKGFNPLHKAADGTSPFGPDYVTWMLLVGLVSCAVWQTAVMRALAAESVEVVRRLYIWSSIGFVIRFVIPQFLGVCALVYLWQNEATRDMFFDADGNLLGNDPENRELNMYAMPVFLSQLLPIGVIGLIGAGMMAAFMSTHDTYLLCWSSVLTEDVVNPIVGGRLSQRARLMITRVLLFVIAAFLLVWSMWYKLEQNLWDYMAVTGAIYFIGAFAVLGAGLYWRRASAAGAYIALCTGAGAILGLGAVQRAFGIDGFLAEHHITSAHILLGITGLAVAGMIVGSLMFPDRNQTAEPLSKE
jgi:SSS family solute:Na+ symporter